jgi:hypothetical protein
MRSVWKLENAALTVRTAELMSRACSLHAPAAVEEGVLEGEEEADALGEADGDVLGCAVGDRVGEAEGDALADAVALADAEADGLAFTCVVIVIVATPFDTVAVTSAPVVPTRKIPANTPDFAWKKSSSSRSSMETPFPVLERASYLTR